MQPLRFTSCMAQNQDAVAQALVNHLATELDLAITFAIDQPWSERVADLSRDRLDFGWVCGLLYVRQKAAQLPVTPLAAPVLPGRRYQNRPIYYSDIIVRQDSPFQTFTDLRGATWAYNEPGSYSGYQIVRHHLAGLDERSGYFGAVVQSTAHQRSLQMVLDGQVDGAAIDSTVLDVALRHDPAIRPQIRAVEVLGPSPIPLWIVSNHLPQPTQDRLKHALLSLHQTASGRRLLAQCGLLRFAAVTDQDYDFIRRVDQEAEGATL